MSPLMGTVLPWIGRVIAPCNEDGDPITNDEEEREAHFERRTVIFAWFNRFAAFPYGPIVPRQVDTANPRQYAQGDL